MKKQLRLKSEKCMKNDVFEFDVKKKLQKWWKMTKNQQQPKREKSVENDFFEFDEKPKWQIWRR